MLYLTHYRFREYKKLFTTNYVETHNYNKQLHVALCELKIKMLSKACELYM